ncbi:hypothetical protein WI460_02380 [Gemmatimonadota bacterium Y43]|uniref:hypothetical protein n=1 Tax=Gaopeijia maritima TaxID=3119007 RepID=UPI003273808C
MKRWTTLSAALLVVAACDTPAPSPDGELVERDSAGVVIAEWSGPIWTSGPRWTIGEPATSIGALESDEPEYLFSGIRGTVALSDGRIVVADGGSNTLRWYDASGVFLMQRGGSGEGPGEFSRLGPIVRTDDDGLVVTDGALHRITRFSSEGELLMTTPIEGVTVPGPAHPLAEGAFVVGAAGFSSTQMTGEEEGLYRASEPLIRIRSEVDAVDTLGIFPGPEIYFRTRSFGGHPFSRGFYYGTAGDRAFVAGAEGFVVDVYAGDGRHLRSIRAPSVDLTLTDELIGAYKDEALRLAAERGERAESSTRSALADMIFPKERPAYGRMVVGDDAIWLEQHSGGVTPTVSRWAVFDHDGAFRGTAEFPAEFRLSTVGDGRVVGSWRDSLGVEYARAYALVETGG